MAKKKAPTPKKRGRPATGTKPIAVQIRAGPAWLGWLDGECAVIGFKLFGRPLDRAEFFDCLTQMYAEKNKRPKPPGR